VSHTNSCFRDFHLKCKPHLHPIQLKSPLLLSGAYINLNALAIALIRS